MSATKDANEKLPDNAVTAPSQRRWKQVLVWAGGVLTTAVVIPAVAWAAGWFTKTISPEEYLAATVTVLSPKANCQLGGEGWVFNKDPQQLPMVRPGDNTDAWAAANGGIPASGNHVKVDLQGRNKHTVIVDSISVNVSSHIDPPQGTWANTWAQCGPTQRYGFEANLDTTPVAVTAVPAESAVVDDQGGRILDSLPHTISDAAPEVWYLTAITTNCICEWTATVNWTSEGNQGHTDITDHGHPFRVAAVTRSTRVLPGDNQWMIVRPQR